MDAIRLYAVLMAVVVVLMFIRTILVMRRDLKVTKLETEFNRLKNLIAVEYRNGGLTRIKTSREGANIETWILVKSDTLKDLEAQMSSVLRKIDNIHSERAKELAYSLISKRG